MENLIQAYILHRRLFRDTSVIIDFFTLEQGIISTVAKGARNPKSKLHGALQFFSPLLISCYGKSELLGLKSAEVNGGINLLSGNYLLSMLYANELLCKLLHKFEAHPKVFSAYQHLIMQFMQQKPIEAELRIFEMQLLVELGYGLNFPLENSTDDADFVFCLEDGIKAISKSATTQGKVYSRQLLQKIQQQKFDDKAILIGAKQLFRQILTALLQHKTINSRELFWQM